MSINETREYGIHKEISIVAAFCNEIMFEKWREVNNEMRIKWN